MSRIRMKVPKGKGWWEGDGQYQQEQECLASACFVLGTYCTLYLLSFTLQTSACHPHPNACSFRSHDSVISMPSSSASPPSTPPCSSTFQRQAKTPVY